MKNNFAIFSLYVATSNIRERLFDQRTYVFKNYESKNI